MRDPPTKVIEADSKIWLSGSIDWKPFSGAASHGQRFHGHTKEDGTPHGIGRCGYMRRNYVYEGLFINGEMSGFGRFVYNNKSYYLGQMLNGLFHGRGMFYCSLNDTRKDGEWEYGSFVPPNKPSEE